MKKMSYAEAMARNAAKKKLILEFLGSGEVYSTVAVLADLLQMHRQNVQTCLNSMVKDGSLKSEMHLLDGHRIAIYGITPHGLAIADKFDGFAFELGRVNPSWIQHRIEGQRMRIKAENAGFKGWTAERELRAQGLKKVPDAVAVAPNGKRIAIEIERHVKTPKRYGDVIAAYVKDINAGRYDYVCYVCPPGIETLVEKAMRRVEVIRDGSDVQKMEPKHLARFTWRNFNNFPG